MVFQYVPILSMKFILEEVSEILNLSNKKLKKLNKLPLEECQNITNLILDDNELQRLDNIDSFVKLQKVVQPEHHCRFTTNFSNFSCQLFVINYFACMVSVDYTCYIP